MQKNQKKSEILLFILNINNIIFLLIHLCYTYIFRISNLYFFGSMWLENKFAYLLSTHCPQLCNV